MEKMKRTKTYSAKGLAWMKVTANGSLEGGIAKSFEKTGNDIMKSLGIKPCDLLLFVADKTKIAFSALGAVRMKLGSELGLAKTDEFNF